MEACLARLAVSLAAPVKRSEIRPNQSLQCAIHTSESDCTPPPSTAAKWTAASPEMGYIKALSGRCADGIGVDLFFVPDGD